jgi:hypothetical protein
MISLYENDFDDCVYMLCDSYIFEHGAHDATRIKDNFFIAKPLAFIASQRKNIGFHRLMRIKYNIKICLHTYILFRKHKQI